MIDRKLFELQCTEVPKTPERIEIFHWNFGNIVFDSFTNNLWHKKKFDFLSHLNLFPPLKFSMGISALGRSAHICPTCRYVRPCISLNTSNWLLKLCGHVLEYIYGWFMGKKIFRFFGPYGAGPCLKWGGIGKRKLTVNGKI